MKSPFLVVFKLKERERREVESGDWTDFKYVEEESKPLMQGIPCLPGGSLEELDRTEGNGLWQVSGLLASWTRSQGKKGSCLR